METYFRDAAELLKVKTLETVYGRAANGDKSCQPLAGDQEDRGSRGWSPLWLCAAPHQGWLREQVRGRSDLTLEEMRVSSGPMASCPPASRRPDIAHIGGSCWCWLRFRR